MHTALPVHPRTGLRALGVTRRGPVWPVLGASDPAGEPPAGDPPKTEPPADPPKTDPPKDPDGELGDAGKKAIKAERDRATAAEKALKAANDRLAAIDAEKLSDVEKAQKAQKDAEEARDAALLDGMRYRIAAKYGLSDEDAKEFLIGSTDEADLERKAQRIKELNDKSAPPAAPGTVGIGVGGGGDGKAKNIGEAIANRYANNPSGRKS